MLASPHHLYQDVRCWRRSWKDSSTSDRCGECWRLPIISTKTCGAGEGHGKTGVERKDSKTGENFFSPLGTCPAEHKGPGKTIGSKPE